MSTATIEDLRFELVKRGILLTVVGETLQVDAPAGAIDNDLRERLVHAKPALIAAHHSNAANDDMGASDNLDLQNITALDRAIKEIATLARWLPDELVMVQARRKRMALNFVAAELARLNEALEHLRSGREFVVPAAQCCQPFGDSER
jgi:TubC N-terminal docking domain